MTATTIWQLAAEHGLSFLIGVACGFALTSRYRIVKRNGGDDGQLRRPDRS